MKRRRISIELTEAQYLGLAQAVLWSEHIAAFETNAEHRGRCAATQRAWAKIESAWKGRP